MYVKGHGQGRKVTFGMSRKASSQRMCMWNMKVLPLMVQKLWHMLKFSDMWVKGHGEGHKVFNFGRNRKSSSQGIYTQRL